MTFQTSWPGRKLKGLNLLLLLGLFWSPISIPNSLAQTTAQPSPKVVAFHQLVSGKWAKITDNVGLAMTDEQLKIAALQCHSAKKISAAKATDITSISKSVSQQFSRLLVYQKLKIGLRRIDFKTRKSLLFPKLKLGKIRGGKDGFEISNARIKITLAFAKIKQNSKSWPVMIEGKALYLKCP